MALKLMYITNNPEIATIAEKAGVDWVFVDLEVIGKKERQGHLDTVMSEHSINDIAPIKNRLINAKLLVRVNPIHKDTVDEIERVIAEGADVIMLPFYTTNQEVAFFLKVVANRVKTCLLCETPEAVEILGKTIDLQGIDYLHIGLNDLHLGYGMKFMFEPLANDMLSVICAKLKKTAITYGFGGIARLGQGTLMAEQIIAEHYHLGSELVILSRTFCDLNKIKDRNEIEKTMRDGIAEIRMYEHSLETKTDIWFKENKKEIEIKVKDIVAAIK
jgi:2-keto-3-deoxy-L-rhamnonate aldolase RhmA